MWYNKKQGKKPMHGSNIAYRLTEAFATGTLKPADPNAPRPGWESLPEVRAAERLYSAGFCDRDVRLFLTFTCAMDRVRDAEQLWQKSADAIIRCPELFQPEWIVGHPTETRQLLQRLGISQRHGPDSSAWIRIAESLTHSNPQTQPVYNAIHKGTGEVRQLLQSLRANDRSRRPYFPLLKGPKISVMWVRMLVVPGRASLQNIAALPVAVDIHVKRVSENLEVVSAQGSQIGPYVRQRIQQAWAQEIQQSGIVAPVGLEGSGGGLDPALWYYGKWGCAFCYKQARRIPISELCNQCRFSP
ncbi:MAG: hypothetical protein N2045_00320 [Fimbriimonadales bacterium]|nr:hypothetical protein [Fimbriimonadales bacterium]